VGVARIAGAGYACGVDTPPLPSELDVLRDVSERLDAAGLPFMLTGSMAMSFYAVPRMTRDIDLVLALGPGDADRIVDLFESDYYLAPEAIDEAMRYASSFNLIHRHAIVKVDCIPRRADAYHLLEFERRQRIELGGFTTWITTREDLILAKLWWARESRSELQLRDVRNLLTDDLDETYVRQWAAVLGIGDLWTEVRP
jgi:hypothetical protein